MVTQEMYNKGGRCRGICQLCREDINVCCQYITDVKGTKYDGFNTEENESESKMKEFDRASVVENYYRATNALMNIGIAENIPEELKQLSINASRATLKIIDYINEHRQ